VTLVETGADTMTGGRLRRVLPYLQDDEDFCFTYGDGVGDVDPGPHPHEAHFLSLDSSRARERLGWRPRWNLDRALSSIVDWHLALRSGADMRALTLQQIEEFTTS
jgi:CDP-glucose 4,6-dehydratase